MHHLKTLTILFVALVVNDCLEIVTPTAEYCNLKRDVINDIASYSNVTNRIIESFTRGAFKGRTWKSLADFVDEFGNRIAGSQNLENAIDYIVNRSNEFNLDRVYTEDVQVPRWVRGTEFAFMVKPRRKELKILGLGLSVGTPPEGILSNAIVVKNFEELRNLPNSTVKGKIVVYDEPYVGYGNTVVYRSKGASEAARKGAVAALVRSITPFSMNTPHTGMMSYDVNVTKIPIAAITLEDADFLWRLQERGNEIQILLKMSASLNKAFSRNTIIERTGTIFKQKVVIVSGHIDSWDVGDGSMDDGGGAFISWMVPISLKELNLSPRRTIRTILWTAEEEGMIGAQAYEEKHRNEENDLSFIMESDEGTFKPLGLTYTGSKLGECMIKEILKLFSSINATEITLVDSPAPDASIWTNKGIPGGGLYNDNKKYYWFHHSEGDRLNVLNSDILDLVSAFWTAFSYIIADMRYEIPRKESLIYQ